VTLDGEATGFESDKVRALLVYLAVESEGPHRREKLAGLLWPDWPERSARNNLRHALAVLRTAIGDREASPPFLHVTRQTVQFNAASDAWVDAAAFGALLQPPEPPGEPSLEHMEEAAKLYQGDLLEGFSLADSPAFEEWMLLSREQYRRLVLEALYRLAEAHGDRGDHGRAVEHARRQTELDPWREEAHRQVMRLLAQSGRRSEALAQYGTCCRLLADELGVEPARETTRLYEQIRDGELVAPVTLARAPDLVPEPPSFLEGGEPAEVERPVFVARDRELAQLDRFLDQALTGQGRVVFVTGESGSGKTALIQEFARQAQEGHADLIVASGNCNAYTGLGDPYLPFREILELLTGDVEARWAAGAMTGEQARRLWNTLPLAAQALVEVGPGLIDTLIPRTAMLERAVAYRPGGTDWLAGLDEPVEHKPIGPGMPSPQQSDLFEQYTRVLQALAQREPLLLAVDDLQWADLGSISLLFHLGRQLPGSRVLIVGAYRPEEVAIGRDGERHPLEPVVNEFQRDFGEMSVKLGRTESREFVDALLDSEPNRLGSAFGEMLYRQTHGHPLFTIELLRGLQDRGDLVQAPDGRWVEGPALDWKTLPARVEAVIAERIGRLAQPLRATLRVASVEGDLFTAEVVARVQGADEREVVRCLSGQLDRRHRLVRAQAIERLGSRRVSRYRFRHNLFQIYLYDSLDKVERAYLHEDVGNVLEDLYGDQVSGIGGRAATGEVAVQLARHFEEAGITEKAIHYLHQAGERAVQLSAYQEAIAHLTRGLALLEALPDSGDDAGRLEHDEQEVRLQLTLGLATTGAMGYGPEVERIYLRARDLCQQVGKTSELCRAVGELSILNYVRAEYQAARELAEEALSLARQVEDPLLVMLGTWHLGFMLFALGEFASSLANLEQVIAFYDPQKHHRPFVALRGSDIGTSAMAYAACCLWCLGFPDQAARRSQEALALARELGHPWSLIDVLSFGGCLFNAMRREGQTLDDDAREMTQWVTEKVPGWMAQATRQRGEAQAMLGHLEEGIALMQKGLVFQQFGSEACYRSGCFCSLAEAQAKAGRPEEGLATLAEGLALVEETDERYWEAELYRVRGELLLMQGDDIQQAESSFQQAIEVARRQQAKSWELRATMSLASLWQRQGKQDEARQMLVEVYDWFTEGFDTPDLVEARALLEELS
jgi:predicted ATPase/DNA-binding SARP family transcriptional activator